MCVAVVPLFDFLHSSSKRGKQELCFSLCLFSYRSNNGTPATKFELGQSLPIERPLIDRDFSFSGLPYPHCIDDPVDRLITNDDFPIWNSRSSSAEKWWLDHWIRSDSFFGVTPFWLSIDHQIPLRVCFGLLRRYCSSSWPGLSRSTVPRCFE